LKTRSRETSVKSDAVTEVGYNLYPPSSSQLKEI